MQTTPFPNTMMTTACNTGQTMNTLRLLLMVSFQGTASHRRRKNNADRQSDRKHEKEPPKHVSNGSGDAKLSSAVQRVCSVCAACVQRLCYLQPSTGAWHSHVQTPFQYEASATGQLGGEHYDREFLPVD